MVLNLERWLKRIEAVPKTIQDAAQTQMEANAELMVQYLKQAAPTRNDISPARRGKGAAVKEAADLDRLRESIRAEPAANRPLTVIVIADPVDEKGDAYAQHVEYGHKTRGGDGHVAARPFWWPTYRAYKKANRQRMSRATLAAVKKEFGK